MYTRKEAREASRACGAFVHSVASHLTEQWDPEVDLLVVVRAVLHALGEGLGGGERRRLEQLLPDLVPTIAGESRRSLGFEEIVERAANAAGAPEEPVRRVVSAVFAELRQLIPADLDRSIASTLPRDLFIVWNGTGPGDSGAEPSAARKFAWPSVPAELHGEHPVFEHVERSAELPENVTGGAAFVATLCLALIGVSGRDAAVARRALPAPLQELLARCARERDEEATPFTSGEFSEALAAELGVTTEHAARIASAVFHGLALELPAHAARKVAAHLPPVLRGLWPAPSAPPATG
jgi:uncharacterized protein (DUF2267 family)